MHDQKSLMLHWRWFLGGGSDIVPSILAQKGGQCIYYVSMAMHSALGAHDARPKIVDAPLQVIFRWR